MDDFDLTNDGDLFDAEYAEWLASLIEFPDDDLGPDDEPGEDDNYDYCYGSPYVSSREADRIDGLR